jgi:hypothetical protein
MSNGGEYQTFLRDVIMFLTGSTHAYWLGGSGSIKNNYKGEQNNCTLRRTVEFKTLLEIPVRTLRLRIPNITRAALGLNNRNFSSLFFNDAFIIEIM